jgi:hypothetical protein
MSKEKTFLFAGSSSLAGKTKVRFANDIMRTKTLTKGGHRDVDMQELPYAMTKQQVAEHFIQQGYGQGNTEITLAVQQLAKQYPTPVALEAASEEAFAV